MPYPALCCVPEEAQEAWFVVGLKALGWVTFGKKGHVVMSLGVIVDH